MRDRHNYRVSQSKLRETIAFSVNPHVHADNNIVRAMQITGEALRQKFPQLADFATPTYDAQGNGRLTLNNTQMHNRMDELRSFFERDVFPNLPDVSPSLSFVGQNTIVVITKGENPFIGPPTHKAAVCTLFIVILGFVLFYSVLG